MDREQKTTTEKKFRADRNVLGWETEKVCLFGLAKNPSHLTVFY